MWIPSAMPIAMRMMGIAEDTSVIGRPTSAITPRVQTRDTTTTARGMNALRTERNAANITRSTTRMTSGISRTRSPLM